MFIEITQRPEKNSDSDEGGSSWLNVNWFLHGTKNNRTLSNCGPVVL